MHCSCELIHPQQGEPKGWLRHPKKVNSARWGQKVGRGGPAKKWHIPADANHPLQILAISSTKIKPKFIEKQSLPPAARWHNRKSSNWVHVLYLNPFMNWLVWMFAFSVFFSLGLTSCCVCVLKRECQPQGFLTNSVSNPLHNPL